MRSLQHSNDRTRAANWLALAAVVVALAAPHRAWAVDIDGVQNAAIDAPQVYLVLQRPGASQPLDFEGVISYIPAYLDTGSSGMLVGALFADLLGLQTEPGVTFSDIGIGGADNFDVSEEIIVRIASNPFGDASDLDVFDLNIGPIRTQVGPIPPPPDPLLDEGFNIVGMPALKDKVVVMDGRPLNQLLESGFTEGGGLSTYIYDHGTPYHPDTPDTDPGVPATSFHVQLSYGDFDRFTQVTPNGSPAPDLAHNPFIGPNPVAQLDATPQIDDVPPVSLDFGGHHATGSFLLDTGGQTSFMSSIIAEQLGVRYVDGTYGTDEPLLETFDVAHPEMPGSVIENQFELLVGGIGAQITAAGFFLDSLTLHTIEGSAADDDPNNIRFLGAPVLVADIGLEDPVTGDFLVLDGTFGINYLVASLYVNVFDLGEARLGAFDWITFDEQTGILGLELAPPPVPEPGSLVLAGIGMLTLAGYAWRRRSARSAR